jgi:hypothetical protein
MTFKNFNFVYFLFQMCSGLFIDADKLDFGQDAGNMKSQSQVALGCNNGAIYILHNFTVCFQYNLCHIQVVVMKVKHVTMLSVLIHCITSNLRTSNLNTYLW